MKLIISIFFLLSALQATTAFVILQPIYRNTLQLQSESTTTTSTLDGRKIQGQVQPLNNFVLVKIAQAQEQTEGGILLTGKAKIQKTEGTVVAVGPGRTHIDSGIVVDMPVIPGDGVVYGQYDGTEIMLNGEKHTLIRDDDILVKFDGQNKLSINNVHVTFDNVLIRVEKKDDATEGGILIAKTSSSQSKPSLGIVQRVGPGRMASNGELMAMDVDVGDTVKFRDFAGNEVEIDGEEYSVVRMADILAKF